MFEFDFLSHFSFSFQNILGLKHGKDDHAEITEKLQAQQAAEDPHQIIHPDSVIFVF